MHASFNRWLAAVGLTVGVSGSVFGQSALPAPVPRTIPNQLPPAIALPDTGRELIPKLPTTPMPMLPPVPVPMAMPAPTPAPSSNAHLLPQLTELSPPQFEALQPGCSTCKEITPGCSDPGCAGDMTLGPKNPVWLSYTTLLLWFQPARSPFNLANGNVPGQSSRVLLNGSREQGMYLAPKISGGMWLNHDHTMGVGLDGFISEHRSQFRTVSGGGLNNNLTITRPFIDAVTGQRAEVIAARASADPTQAFAGSMAETVTARFASAGVNIRRNQVYDEQFQFDVFYGFRYYDLSESLIVFQNTTVSNPNLVRVANQPVSAGSNLLLRDRSFTRNQFYGGELGSYLEYKNGIAFFSITPKVAFGSVHQVTQINGETSTTGATTIAPVDGGLLAAGRGPSNGNLGRFVTNRFGLGTDINMQVGVTISKGVRLAVGYQFYYLSHIARPGNQLDQTINTRVVPVSSAFGSLSGPRAPNVTFDREGFYAHGAAISFEASY